MSHGIEVLQPVRLKDPEFVDRLRALEADLFIVIAFRMLPEVVWTMPRLGTFNLHASLLPRYRGAAPINRAVMNGDTGDGRHNILPETRNRHRRHYLAGTGGDTPHRQRRRCA